MIQRVDSFLKSADQFCDYAPFISSVSNAVDLFQKCVVIPCLSQKTIAGSHYYTHLSNKNFSRCITLLFPVLGNLTVYLYDKFFASPSQVKNTPYPDRMFALFKKHELSIETLPQLDLSGRRVADYPSFQTEEVSAPIMRFTDDRGRPGLVFRLQGHAEGDFKFGGIAAASGPIPIKTITGTMTVFKRDVRKDSSLWKVAMGGKASFSMHELHTNYEVPTDPHGMRSGNDVDYETLDNLLGSKDRFFKIA